MSDDVFPDGPQPELEPESTGEVRSHLDARQLDDDVAALSELTAAGVEIDGEAQVAESTWVIYGHTSYDGEVIAGEYHDAVEAVEVLRAVPAPHPDESRTNGTA